MNKVNNQFIRKNLAMLIFILCLAGSILRVLGTPMIPSCVSLLYICVFLYLFCNYYTFRAITKLRPLVFWLLLTIYHLINAKMHNVSEINYADFLHGFKVYASICIFAFFLYVDYTKSLKCLIASFLIYVFVNLVLCGFVMRREDGEEGVITAVAFGKSGYMIAIFMVYYCAIKGYSFLKLLKFMIIPVLITLYAQTRTAFAVVLMQIMGFYYSVVLKTKLNLKNATISIIIVFICYLGVSFMLNNSKLGERFTTDNYSTHQERIGIKTGTIFDEIAGERLTYYVIGWNLFLESPITGIGLDEYQHATGGDYPMHVEYMKHLTEGGIIGAFLFLSFLISLAIEIKNADVDKRIRWLVIFTFISNLFLYIYSSSYKQEMSVIIYSIIISIALKDCALARKYK